MLQGLALSVEGLVDVYTLQTEAADPQLDEPDETSGQGSGQVNEQRAQRQFWNFAAALALLHRSPVCGIWDELTATDFCLGNPSCPSTVSSG